MGNYWAFINNIRVAPKSRDMFGRETDQRDKITNFHHKSGQELTHNRCKPIIYILYQSLIYFLIIRDIQVCLKWGTPNFAGSSMLIPSFQTNPYPIKSAKFPLVHT
jgi:hypothetical protein